MGGGPCPDVSNSTTPESPLETVTMISQEYVGSSSSAELNNRLYNMRVCLRIRGCPDVHLNAILDTGATVCCVEEERVPKEGLEESKMVAQFAGLNSTQQTRKKLKEGYMLISGHVFPLPIVYALNPMKIGKGIQFIIGCNFIRKMGGGVRLEGPTVTFYRNVSTIETQERSTVAATIGAVNEERTMVFPRFRAEVAKLIKEGYIGDDPLRHWKKDKVTCTLRIKNPDLIIQDPPLKHVTPATKVFFQNQIGGLLKANLIRPSRSRHRTTAFMVESGTTVDPKTGKETRGKQRMVLNYKRLNDNTEKDQYSLPGINTIVSRVSGKEVFSKFDLKSGFHQIKMAEESIPWTAFWTPEGLYEFLVMPFGLVNAPADFQRRMDEAFKGTEAFIAVYIDDILVFSDNEAQHEEHLMRLTQIVRKHGLILSPTKMKIGVNSVEFLGVKIHKNKVQLQEHILKKIADFKEQELLTKKGLRSWLGILNYARMHIPNLGKMLGPLYGKTSPTGEIRFNSQDWKLVREIKKMIHQLPPLELPPKDCCIVLEADGCMDGWGAICKWKKSAYDPRTQERIAAYASGKFQPIKSTIDAEIFAIMNAMEAFKIYYLDKKEMIIRTDCQAIVSFFNKSASNKPSRARWIAFTDYITGTGIRIKIEHIDGKDNTLADYLSRLVLSLVVAEWKTQGKRSTAHQQAQKMAQTIGSCSRQQGPLPLREQQLKQEQEETEEGPWDIEQLTRPLERLLKGSKTGPYWNKLTIGTGLTNSLKIALRILGLLPEDMIITSRLKEGSFKTDCQETSAHNSQPIDSPYCMKRPRRPGEAS
nr:polyprotein [Sweet potato pakakuy virus]